MAGIRYDQLNLIKRAGMKLKIAGSTRVENVLTLGGLGKSWSDFKYNTTQRIVNFMR